MTTDFPTKQDELLSTVKLDALDSRKSRERFEENMRRAHEGGASLRQIAEASGLSFQRVHQIIKKEQA